MLYHVFEGSLYALSVLMYLMVMSCLIERYLTLNLLAFSAHLTLNCLSFSAYGSVDFQGAWRLDVLKQLLLMQMLVGCNFVDCCWPATWLAQSVEASKAVEERRLTRKVAVDVVLVTTFPEPRPSNRFAQQAAMSVSNRGIKRRLEATSFWAV